MKVFAAAIMAGMATLFVGLPAAFLFSLVNGFSWELFFNITGGVYFTTMILFWLTIINE